MQRPAIKWPNYRDVRPGDRVIVQPLADRPLPEGLHSGDSVILVEFHRGNSIVRPMEDDGRRWVVRDDCISPSTDLWIGGVPDRRPEGMALWTGDIAITCRSKHDVAQLPEDLSSGTAVVLVEFAYGFWVVRPDAPEDDGRRWVVFTGCLRSAILETTTQGRPRRCP